MGPARNATAGLLNSSAGTHNQINPLIGQAAFNGSRKRALPGVSALQHLWDLDPAATDWQWRTS